MTRNARSKRLEHLIHCAAEQAAPHDLDLWPQIAQRLYPLASPAAKKPPHRRELSFAAIPALLVVVVLAALAIILAQGLLDHNDGGMRFAALHQEITPTISPPAATGVLVAAPQGDQTLPPSGAECLMRAVNDTITVRVQPRAAGMVVLDAGAERPAMIRQVINVDAGPVWVQVEAPAADGGTVIGWVERDTVQFVDCTDPPQPHPLALPTPQPPDLLCERYPDFCVPFIGGPMFDDHPMTLIESPANPRAPFAKQTQFGVLRGLTFEGVPWIGNPAAPIKIEVWIDFRCPHCFPFYEDVLKPFIEQDVLMGRGQLQVRFVNVTGSNVGHVAAQTVICAGEQGAFWEMLDATYAHLANADLADYEHFTNWIPALGDIAVDLGLDREALQHCVVNEHYDGILTAWRHVATAHGVTGVPSALVYDPGADEWLPVERTYQGLTLAVSAAPAPAPETALVTPAEPTPAPQVLTQEEIEALMPESTYLLRVPKALVAVAGGDPYTLIGRWVDIAMTFRTVGAEELHIAPPMYVVIRDAESNLVIAEGPQTNYIVERTYVTTPTLMLTDVLVVGVDADTLVLAPVEADALTLTWAIDTGIPMTFTPTNRRADAGNDMNGRDITLWGCTATVQNGSAPDTRPLEAYTVATPFDFETHKGIDLAAEPGMDVMAAGSGTVIFARWRDDGYGMTVVIAHDTTFTLYAHLEGTVVGCGDVVSAGDVIGTVGSTGDATGPHLHFEIRDEQFMPRDPAGWLDF